MKGIGSNFPVAIKQNRVKMLMIIKETERLASLSGEELEDWLRKAQSICEYNFNLLWSKQDFYHRLNY